MDYLTMRDIFKGLASSGSWGCFDEFNRLIAEVLSVCTIQYKSVLDGIRAGGDYFRFDGIETYLHPDGCMSFITMNPGYLGRQELPESLKVLFRPVTVMVPGEFIESTIPAGFEGESHRPSSPRRPGSHLAPLARPTHIPHPLLLLPPPSLALLTSAQSRLNYFSQISS